MRAMWYLFLSVVSQVHAEALKVSGHVGHNVTMPCAYSAQAHGLLSFCWGRGKVPTFTCSNTIIYAEDGVVSFISESRYQLLGHLSDGDVSLTILNVRPGDTGVYGCRVEIPGMFNDYKVNIYLAVEEAPSQQPVTQVSLPVTAKRQQAISEVSEFEHAGGDDLTLNWKGRAEEAASAFQEVGNICRIAAIISLTVLIIPIFIASEKRPRPLTHLKTSTRENVYEMI
ncbi:hepatitis A virus cellular receptor 1 homolog isoform X2 [Hippocampus zosterae]|uniref:hepatitis A virus cellular receptor 1 homolog isoform X2 n=1 Tax=Hippocampus zosterae TaxID=109293 RepID=UPI00223E2DA2|nr:hepatitis A virus cellular receptor 1 homolog isoform X2 [Hippocampus zosterae]